MFTILVVFAVLAFALMLYGSLQDQIPDELAFLRAPANAAQPTGAKVSQYKGWQVAQQGATVELTKLFNPVAAAGTVVYPAPQIGILCHDGKLDIRVDTKTQTTGTQASPVLVGTSAQNWGKGEGNNLFPSQPTELLRDVLRATSGLTISFSYRTQGVQPSVLDVDGAYELVRQLPSGCQPY